MSGLLLGRLGAAVVVVGGSAGVTWAVTDTGQDPTTTAGPAAWIDDPLDASVLPADVGEVVVVAHATDPDGIVAVVLTVDGAEVDAATMPADDLVIADDLRWSPPGPGTYELRVVGRDPGGATTPPGIAHVQVGADEEQPTTTTVPGDTTTVPGDSTTSSEATPGSTSTTAAGSTTTRPGVTTTTAPGATTSTSSAPTTTTCVPGTTTNQSPAHGGSVGTKTPTLEWAYAGCGPDSFSVQVSRDAAFSRTEAEGSAAGTDRSWVVSPELSCNITYWFRVRSVVGRTTGAWSSPTSFTVSFRTCA